MADLLALADRVLSGAGAGEDVEVYAVHRVTTTVQAGTGGVVRQVVRAETRGLGVRLVAGHRTGYASTSDLGDASLARTLDRARTNARLSAVDEAGRLPTPTSGPVLAPPASGRVAAMPLQAKTELASRLATLVTSIDERVRGVDTAEYRDERTEVGIASTLGVRVHRVSEHAELWTDALAEDAHGQTGGDASWWGRDPAGADVEALAAEAVHRAVRLLGPVVALDPGLPVVLDPQVVSALLATVGRACTGGALASGRSPFARLAGAPAAAACVTLLDDGTAVDVPASSPSDDEGVPRRRTELIAAGRLTGALHSTATATAAGGGASSTGNARRPSYRHPPRAAPTALRLAPTTSRASSSDGAVLTGVGDAVHVQQLAGAGTGISALTGRVDVGCVGWLVRDGVPSGRIASTPLASSLPAVLRAVTAVADDARHVPGTPVHASTVLCDGGTFWRP